MRLRLNINALERNLLVLKEFATLKGVALSVMAKRQFHHPDIQGLLRKHDVKTYTTGDVAGWVDIYNNKWVQVVDAVDKREGISMKEAEDVVHKGVAIVNFCCCTKKIPTEYETFIVTRRLQDMGYETVSMGGSLLLGYDNIHCDEIRIGEAFFTGYSSEPYEKPYQGMENPFEIEFDVWSGTSQQAVIRQGFFTIGGFTDAKAVCVNTDFSVIELSDARQYRNGKLVLKPDYYTLIKVADKYGLDNVLEVVHD